jgi:hypothetical protein
MGEVSLGLESWWDFNMSDLDEKAVPVGFSDEANKVIVHSAFSYRFPRIDEVCSI